MATAFVEHTIDKNWAVTQNNFVGPTTDTTTRPNSALPWSAARSTGAPDFDTINKDNDANTIYLDPDGGNDANTGTDLSSDAVLTWSVALGLITATRHVLHIESTTATDSSLTVDFATTGLNIGNDLDVIQVASGQTCTLSITGGGNYLAPALEDINGLKIIGSSVEGNAPLVFSSGVTTGLMEWVRIESLTACLLTSQDNTYTTNNCIFISKEPSSGVGNQITDGGTTYFIDDYVMSGKFTINESILVNSSGVSRHGILLTSASGANQIDQQHVTFVNVDNVNHATAAITTLTTVQNRSNIYQGCGTLLKNDSSTSNVTAIVFSLINTRADGTADTSATTNVKNQDPIFRNPGLFDYRLAHVGVVAGTQNGRDIFYPITSPAVGIGASSTDAGAFDFTYTIGTESVEQFDFPACPDYDSVRLIPERLNYQGFNDIQGKFHNTWDDLNDRIEINFKGSAWLGGDFSSKFKLMFRAKGLKRYYPSGSDGVVDGNFAPKISTVPDGSTIVIVPTHIPRDITDKWYTGWVARLEWTDGGTKVQYALITNQVQTGANILFTLSKLRGDDGYNVSGITNVSFRVLYLPVQVDMDSVNMVSEYYSEDEDSVIFKPWYPDDGTDPLSVEGPVPIASKGVRESQFHVRTIILKQTLEESDPE